eukprot:1910143-Pyramimonas_sp.AAC.1
MGADQPWHWTVRTAHEGHRCEASSKDGLQGAGIVSLSVPLSSSVKVCSTPTCVYASLFDAQTARGKNETGVAKAIEVSLRPKNSGLGACQADMQMRKKKEADKEIEPDQEEEKTAAPAPKLWKKKNQEKRIQREYKVLSPSHISHPPSTNPPSHIPHSNPNTQHTPHAAHSDT